MDAVKPMSKLDENFAKGLVGVLNTKSLIIIPAVEKYSGSAVMMLAVVHDEKVCPIGRVMTVEEIEYGHEVFLEPDQMVSGSNVPGLELWYENRYIKPSGGSTTPSDNNEPSNG